MSISGLMWWKSEVNFSPFLDLAACRIRPSACVTLSRLCVRRMLCCSGVFSVPALRSASFVEDLFADFIATTARFWSAPRFGHPLGVLSPIVLSRVIQIGSAVLARRVKHDGARSIETGA
jgi:hypothetical protein